MVVVVAYLGLILLACALAWLLWQIPAVRRLDDRILGERGLAVVASVAAVLLTTYFAVTLVQRVWAVATVFGLLSCWVGYGAYRRVNNLREASRG